MAAKGSERELYKRAQEMLVGSLLAEGEATPRVLELLDEGDVEEPSLALIFSSLAELSRRNETASAVSVAKELETRGELAKAGGLQRLYGLASAGKGKYLLDAPVDVYARIVKESSAKAKISRIIEERAPDFKDNSGVQAADAVASMQDYLNERLLSLSDSSTTSSFVGGFERYKELLEERAQIAKENPDGLQGIPSLLPTLNKITGGWKPGQLITVGAGTGGGKSVFAVNCAMAAAAANASVLMFSLEMSREQIEDRFIASTTGVELDTLKRGSLTDAEKLTIDRRMEAMQDYKITLDTEPNLTVDSIRARAIKQAQSPEGLDFMIIDYLQLIESKGRHGSRQEEVASISRNIKLLAKQLGIPIMALVQLNRNKDDEADALPTLEKIRESHAIAQDSDIVILLHRAQAMDDTMPHTLVIVDKNRDGQNKKIIPCHTNLACALFREVNRDTERVLEVGDSEEGGDYISDDFDDDLDLSEFEDDFEDDGGELSF